MCVHTNTVRCQARGEDANALMNGWQRLTRAVRLPQLDGQVWILALGRLLSQMGSGFTLFYAPIFFVNQVGLSATAVGLGLGSQSISGVVGRMLGGTLSDGQMGRKKTLLLAAVVAAIASFVLAATINFPIFVVGNLLMGFGIGLYWPAAEALIADLSTPAERNEAFAINRLCDGLGLGLGVVLGGVLVNTTGAYRSLFIIDGVSFLILMLVVSLSITEVRHSPNALPAGQGWRMAMGDRTLLTYCAVNILFTTYIVQISSTLPLYLTNFVAGMAPAKGFDSLTLSALFTWHLVAAVLFQLPIARVLNRFDRLYGLMISAICWAIGFGLVSLTGVATGLSILWAVLALGMLALATVTYTPIASAVVVEMAPEALRGVYLAVNSLCWAVGYFIGPPLGGWALDQAPVITHGFWMGLAASVAIAIAILVILQRMLQEPAR